MLLLALLLHQPAAAAELQALTFNTWGLPAPVARSRRGRFPGIERFLAERAPDVVALQEVWRGARSLLALPGLSYPQGTHDSGLAVLSPHPVRDSRHISFDRAVGFDALKEKGALAVTVDHAELGPLTVVSTHLQAGHGARPARVRGTQVDELLALVASIDGPLLLMGDFNLYDDLDADVASHARLRAAGLLDAAEHFDALDPTHDDGCARLDRVYARGLEPVSAEVLPADGMSDHLPVAVGLVGR